MCLSDNFIEGTFYYICTRFDDIFNSKNIGSRFAGKKPCKNPTRLSGLYGADKSFYPKAVLEHIIKSQNDTRFNIDIFYADIKFKDGGHNAYKYLSNTSV